ncbi:MAG TPA: LytR C-terminal domain-containing protein [Micromonosporaceae bacterium]|nr:LytR C-terminal domain-containing protein [Micromonosporaceae bacterium]
MNAARIRAFVIVGLIMVGALVTAFVTIGKDSQTRAHYTSDCPTGSIPVHVSSLPPVNEINLKIWNASEHAGLAEQVADDFRHRGFNVAKVGTHDNKPTFNGVANIYYGPSTIAGAWVVRSYLLLTGDGTSSAMHFDIKRTSNVIDVVLGKGFRQLGAKTEVNSAIAALGTPNPPPGTCSVS